MSLGILSPMIVTLHVTSVVTRLATCPLSCRPRHPFVGNNTFVVDIRDLLNPQRWLQQFLVVIIIQILPELDLLGRALGADRFAGAGVDNHVYTGTALGNSVLLLGLG